VVGDRVWAVADEDGCLVSAKHPARGGRLLQVRARFDDATEAVSLTMPDGSQTTAGTAEADEVLGRWLGFPVRMVRDVTGDHQLRRWWPSERGLVPEWVRHDRAGTDAVTDLAGPQRCGSFVDYGAVHLVMSHDLVRLRALGYEIDATRFRPNVVIDPGRSVRPGDRIRIGGTVLAIDTPTPRCAVPGVSETDAAVDRGVLRGLARFDRKSVGSLGNAACFGFYAVPSGCGQIHDGDTVTDL
jgi:uncharacterized protein YcbX